MSSHAASPVTSHWLLSVDGPRGKSTPTLTILSKVAKANSEKGVNEFSGVLVGPRGRIAIDTVQIQVQVQAQDKSLSFPLQVQTAFGTFELKYSGQVDDDAMTGTVTTPRGERAFTGQRQ
ncbi:MAG: hypothetical protein P8N67_06070 [Pseudomonadales bacterium]|nr:hypothetical protein [Pseudomonadales bacterium]